VSLMRTGMSADWSWDRSAGEYLHLYEEIGRRVLSRNAPLDGSEPSGRSLPRRGTS
jgi:hypothetical protein